MEKLICQLATPARRHFFCGYYDVSPISKDHQKLCTQEAAFIDRMPQADDLLAIGYIDLTTGRWHALANTRTWNWQQGCRLQWLGPDFNRYVIYNDKAGDQLRAYILEVATGSKQVLPMPVYSVTPDGRYAVTLNFARLQRTRPGYGYEGIADPFEGVAHPREDGIYLLDLQSREYHLIISLAQLCQHRPRASMQAGPHWVNHLMFNKSGRRFMFCHRYGLPGGGIYTRLYTAAYDGSDLYLLLDSGMASHACWRNDETIICWGRPESAVSALSTQQGLMRYGFKWLRPIYRRLCPVGWKQKITGDAYLIIKDQVGVVGTLTMDLVAQDGHCSVSPCGKWLLTDTYPDHNYQRTLLLYDFARQEVHVIGRYYSLPTGMPKGWEISAARCDLHPRWSFDGSTICFDSVHEGYRGVYLVNCQKLGKC